MNRSNAPLVAARTAAWALLFGGWLVLGALALRHGPGGAGWLAPLALWLASVALAQRALARAALAPGALRALLLLAGAVAAVGVVRGQWLLAAPAWGLLLVAASTVVKRQRVLRVGTPAPSPRGAALLAALLGAAVAGDPGAGAPLAAVPLVLAVVLAMLVPTAPATISSPAACRSSLFDCALGGPSWQAWRQPQARLPAVAALAMLPMMALLPWMAEACRATGPEAGLGPRSLVALHLLAMLLPAWWPRRVPAACVAALLVAGGGVALLWPAGNGPMGAMLLQAVAWGCVWRQAVVPGPGRPGWAPEQGFERASGQACAGAAPGAGVGAGVGTAGALAVLLLGAALMSWPGPPTAAMAAVAVLLGVAAAAAWLGSWWSGRAGLPSRRQPRSQLRSQVRHGAPAPGGHGPSPSA
jgi:hypothetical protein